MVENPGIDPGTSHMSSIMDLKKYGLENPVLSVLTDRDPRYPLILVSVYDMLYDMIIWTFWTFYWI